MINDLNANSKNDVQNDVEEVISLISQLNEKQKELVLATVRGAVMIADSDKKEA